MQPTLTFHEHIKELRLRVIYVVVALGVTGGVSYVLRSGIIKFIQRPLHSALYFTSPAGSFNFIIKICTILGIFLALPVIVYNIIRFIEPALPKQIKSKVIYKFTFASFILAVVGAAFGYYIIVPMSLHFFLSYSSASVRPLIIASEYLSFILNVLITFALIFQIPLVVLFINFIKPLNPRNLLRYQRYIVVAALIIAVLLPFTYDPISQFVLALPILFSFYFSVFLVKIANRKHKLKPVVVSEEVIEPVVQVVTEMPALEPLTIEPAVEPEIIQAIEEPKPKSRKTMYIDGFVNAKPANPLIGFKTFDVLPVAEYRARNTLKGTKRNLSIDGFMFASE